MTSLVADLLLLARLEEGQDFEATDVDLTDLVADAVNDAAVSAPTHRWLTTTPDTPVRVRGDRAQLHQPLANLLSNARVHTPPGSTVTTSVATGRAADGTAYVEVAVSDDGPGIDAEMLPHLFERFVRADKSRSRQTGSLGLGLSIAASIVESHGRSPIRFGDNASACACPPSRLTRCPRRRQREPTEKPHGNSRRCAASSSASASTSAMAPSATMTPPSMTMARSQSCAA